MRQSERVAVFAVLAPQGLWSLAWSRLCRDTLGLIALGVVVIYLAVVLAAAAGWIAKDWSHEAGVNYAPPNGWIFSASPSEDRLPVARESIQVTPVAGVVDPLAPVIETLRESRLALAQEPQRLATLPLGADKWGRDVALKTLKGTQTSFIVGLLAAFLSVLLGSLLGAYAGYFGGIVDDVLNWIYSTFTAIPYLLLVLAIAAVLNQKGISTVILILGLTGWTGVFRLMRAEYMKHRNREYVLAAESIGASHARRMFYHILPNVSHVLLVQLSLNVVSFMKSEVILSFLGFGVGVDTVSWGSMLNEAQTELLLGKWWQLASATLAMALLVTAFSVFTDALRDALDPKLK